MADVQRFATSLTHSVAQLRSRGTMLVLLVLLIITVFVIPVPWYVLDLLIAINIGVSLILLLRCLYGGEGDVFEAFPAILLLTTLYRLSLNVSSTRLILLNGDQGTHAAGEVIQAFGEFVVRGDFIVGAIVFVVIATVNFLVVARGSARVAEVAARFSLDALPGKQLAIDADLRAGSISRVEAEERRDALARETRFYGAMDGAMKFVQGDAIAALIIAGVCAFGGVALGLLRGLEFQEAVNTFGVLTIGDGLVTILPSLFISVSSGIVVTQVSSARRREGTADAVVEQFLFEPRALTIVALGFIGLGVIAALPGVPIPFFPFLLIGMFLLLLLAYRSFTKYPPLASLAGRGLGFEAFDEKVVPHVVSVRGLLLELDPRVLPSRFGDGGSFVSQMKAEFRNLREDMYRSRGLPLPELEISLEEVLHEGGYRIWVREEMVREGTVVPEQVFATVNPATLQVLGASVLRLGVHPVDRRTGAWIQSDPPLLASLRRLGVEVFTVESFLITEALGAAYEAVDELFGLDEVHTLVQSLKRVHPHIVHEVLEKNTLSYPEFTEVLRRLVRERVTIRDLKLILEGVSEFAASHPDKEDRVSWLDELHRSLRRTLSRSIVADALSPGQRLRGFVLSPDLEAEFRAAVADWQNGQSRPLLEPGTEAALKEASNRMFQPVLERGAVPIVVMCSGDIRRAVHDFFTEQLTSADWLRTVAFEELDRRLYPESVGILSVK